MKGIDKVFFDSNILIYAVDGRDLRKQKIAIDVITKSIEEENGIISTQSIQEFYSASTKKLLCPPDKAMEYARNFANSFTVCQVDLELIFRAMETSRRNKLSFWDSLIVSAAAESGCALLYSEDLSDGEIVSGVKLVNPFV